MYTKSNFILAFSALATFAIAPVISPVAAEDADPKDGSKIQRLESGLVMEDIKVGDGKEAKKGTKIVVHYTGWLADGIKFDSSVDRGAPFEFALGAGMVIKGWEEGFAGMKVGGKRRLLIPAELAYGEKGAGEVIPPNSSLIFEVELLEVK